MKKTAYGLSILGIVLSAPFIMAPNMPSGCRFCELEASGSLLLDQYASHSLLDLSADGIYMVEATLNGSLDLDIQGHIKDLSCYSLSSSEICEFVSVDGTPVTAELTGTASLTEYDLYFGEL